MSEPQVLVVGGGISGIATAWWLARAGVPVEVWESGADIGGKIRSEHHDGYLVERAAAMLLNFRPEVTQLMRESGVESHKVLRSEQASAHRYLSMAGGLQRVPATAAGMMGTSLWSWRSRLRMLAEPFVPRRVDDTESVADFIRRRLGEELLEKAIDPFVAGTLAADPELANAATTLPRLVALERRYGSLTMGVIWHKLIRRRTAHVTEAFSFAGGMITLLRELAAAEGVTVRRHRVVRAIHREGDGWRVQGEYGHSHTRNLVLSTPAEVTAGLLRETDAELAAVIAGIPYAPLSVVHLGFERQAVDHPLDGSGFLTGRKEGAYSNGNLWMSSLFPGRAPQGRVLLTSYVGGSRRPDSVDWSAQRLRDAALADLNQRLGLQRDPEWAHLHRHRRALPVYHGDHMARTRSVDQALQALPGLHLCANYLGGVALRDRVVAARQTALQLINSERVTCHDSLSVVPRYAPLLARQT